MLQAKEGRAREKELLDLLAKNPSTEARMFKELFGLRLERYKDALVATGCDLKRGRASELADLIKNLDRVT